MIINCKLRASYGNYLNRVAAGTSVWIVDISWNKKLNSFKKKTNIKLKILHFHSVQQG